MKKKELSILLDLAKSASLEAGKFLLENRGNKQEILSSEGRDIKLKVDVDTEVIIREALIKESQLPILGEEKGKNKDLDELYWVVDPLDGTSNFLRGIPISCVSIALINNLEPIIGVIYDFNLNNLYYASKDTPSYLNGKEIKVSDVSQKNQSTLMTGIPAKKNYTNSEFKNMIDDFQSWKKIRMIGSAAISSIYVASGKAEAYSEKGIYLWDVAAGGAIVTSSGGKANIDNLQADYRVDAKFTNNLINFSS
mgnify:FL=1